MNIITVRYHAHLDMLLKLMPNVIDLRKASDFEIKNGTIGGIVLDIKDNKKSLSRLIDSGCKVYALEINEDIKGENYATYKITAYIPKPRL
jgi:hypothetical protein